MSCAELYILRLSWAMPVPGVSQAQRFGCHYLRHDRTLWLECTIIIILLIKVLLLHVIWLRLVVQTSCCGWVCLMARRTSVGVSVHLCIAASQPAGAPAARGGATNMPIPHNTIVHGKPLHEQEISSFFFFWCSWRPPRLMKIAGCQVRPCPEPPQAWSSNRL